MMQGRVHFLLVAAVFLICFYLLFAMVRPFFDSLMWALVLSVVFFIPHRKIRERVRNENVAASLSLVGITVCILLPVAFLIPMLTQELGETLSWLENEIPRLRNFDPKEFPLASRIWDAVSPYVSTDINSLTRELIGNIRQLGGTLINYFSFAFVNVFSFAFKFIMMLVALFFFLRDSERILIALRRVVPFDDEERSRLIGQLKDMIIATLYGGLSVALVQGIVGGISLWLLDVRAPVLWGTVMAFLAFVPVVGAGLVWVPITIYWLLTGAFGKAVVLLIVGTLGISMVDYILRPIVIGNRTKMHTLLIFLSVLGGLGYFGFVGIVVGPMVALTCMALINMYVDTPGSRFLSGRGDEADWSP